MTASEAAFVKDISVDRVILFKHGEDHELKALLEYHPIHVQYSLTNTCFFIFLHSISVYPHKIILPKCEADQKANHAKI